MPDMLIIPQEDGRFNTTMLPIQICIYSGTVNIQYHPSMCSGHPPAQSQTMCSNTNLLHQEEEHLQKVLTRCKYPSWALNRIENKIHCTEENQKPKQEHFENCQQHYIVVAYYQGLSESVERTCNKHGVQVYWEVSPSKAS